MTAITLILRRTIFIWWWLQMSFQTGFSCWLSSCLFLIIWLHSTFSKKEHFTHHKTSNHWQMTAITLILRRTISIWWWLQMSFQTGFSIESWVTWIALKNLSILKYWLNVQMIFHNNYMNGLWTDFTLNDSSRNMYIIIDRSQMFPRTHSDLLWHVELVLAYHCSSHYRGNIGHLIPPQPFLV